MPLQTYNQYFRPPEQINLARSIAQGQQVPLRQAQIQGARQQNALGQLAMQRAPIRAAQQDAAFARKKQQWGQQDAQALHSMMSNYYATLDTSKSDEEFLVDLQIMTPPLAKQMESVFGPERSQEMVSFLQDKVESANRGNVAQIKRFSDLQKSLLMGPASAAAKVVKNTYSKKNPDGSTRTIPNVELGSEQEKQLKAQGFVLGSQTVGAKFSSKERENAALRGRAPLLEKMALEDPNKFHKNHNFRQNDDGSLYVDPATDTPQRLKPFFNSLGKRGNIKAVVALGEQMRDADELLELMKMPSVQENLSKANTEGLWAVDVNATSEKDLWNSGVSKAKNTWRRWLQEKGIAGDSPTATAIARIQRIASQERKRFMGTAVTENEIQSSLAWMPNAGDSFETIINKSELMGKEAKQEFKSWLIIGNKDSDMSPFYKAFGIKRFPTKEENIDAAGDAFINSLSGGQ